MQIIKHIPNTITSMNLLAGTLGVIFTLDGRIDIAFPLMLAAAGFDFCDGFAARLLKAYSEIGKELDSLADMVSFGVLPAIMLYKTMTVCGTWDVICYGQWRQTEDLAVTLSADISMGQAQSAKCKETVLQYGIRLKQQLGYYTT